ncbi:MAG: acyl carrier protein [Firmicutes bacterium]|nr:acyl carrier protein [Bacillota bacterium]MBQ4093208.1 acyl carrier protein [Bacillota bacterium]
MNDAIYQVVADIIADVMSISAEEVAPEKTMKDLNVDSLDMLDIVTSLEDHYGIEIPDDALDCIKTVGDAVNYLDKLVG